MAIRDYNFTTGPQQSTVPTATTPTDDNDTISKGYADTTYTPRAHNYGKVSDITALKAIGSSSRFDEQIIWVSGKMTFYEFDAGSSAVADDDLIVQPTSGTGRWIKQFPTVAGGASGASGVESLEQKLENEHYKLFTDELDNSVGSGFAVSGPVITGRLLADHTTGTTVYFAWNPVYINNADKNTDSTTGWLAQGAGTNLGTSGTKKIGTASLSFDKDGSGTNARIRYDRGAADLSINGFTDLYFWINMPSITNFLNVEVRVDIDGTNYQTYTVTTNDIGGSITTGWNLVKFDLASAGSASGTGWDKTKLFRYLHLGVNTTSGAQTYTAILIDSVHFSQANPTELIQLGSRFTIANTSDIDDIIIDSTSVRVSGTVTLAASLTTAYNGGTNSSTVRSSLLWTGNNKAEMENALSGEAADTQSVRINRILNESLSAQNFKLSADVNTNCIFKVLSVVDSDTITVEDNVNQSANIVSGVVLHTFKTHFNSQGMRNFENRNLDLTVTSSSWGSNILTINTGTNTGIAVGDYVVMNHLTQKISLVAVTANENFVTPTTDDVFLMNNGVPYPNRPALWGHWFIGGLTDSEGTKFRNGSRGIDFSKNGTPNLRDTFLNGQFSGSGWTTSNYLSIATADSQEISGDSVDTALLQVSFWFYETGGSTSQRLVARNTATANEGWLAYLNTATSQIIFSTPGTDHNTRSYTTAQWNHYLFVLRDGGTSFNYLNGVKSATYTPTVVRNTTLPLVVGVDSTLSATAALTSKIADLVIWRNGSEITQAEAESIYNLGRHRILNFGPMLKYRQTQNSITGQKLSIESKLSRTTDDARVFLGKIGAIKS